MPLGPNRQTERTATELRPVQRLKIAFFGTLVIFAALGAGEAVYRLLFLDFDGAKDRLPLRVVRIAQSRGDVGERMDTACRRFRCGNVAIIGSDIPHANAADLRAAFRALGSHDAVFGPAEDGGYWLVALGPRRPAQPFVNARWSTQHALADTLRNFRGRRVALLRTLRDVDTVGDLPLAGRPRIRDDL